MKSEDLSYIYVPTKCLYIFLAKIGIIVKMLMSKRNKKDTQLISAFWQYSDVISLLVQSL